MGRHLVVGANSFARFVWVAGFDSGRLKSPLQLTPGRYVDMASEEVDEDFDAADALREIHLKLHGLNEEAVVLAAQIALNFEESGI